MKIGNIDLGEMPLFLAPMENVTDPSFRRVCKPFGVDMMYSEFVSSEGLIRDAAKSKRKLFFEEEERPMGIQIYGHLVDSLVEAALISEAAGPDLIDINFGCPVKKIAGRGAGAGLLRDLPKMLEITAAVAKAVKLPVTVKTRLGWDYDDMPIVELAERLQDVGAAAITIHGRTRNQLYTGQADWTLIGETKNNPRLKIPVIGNGDITSAEIALQKRNQYGVDGLMIGRGAIGNPWLFREIKYLFATGQTLPPPNMQERVELCRKHIQSSIQWKGEKVAGREMRKHYTLYFKGYPHFKSYRMRLVTVETFDEIEQIFTEMLANFE
jgi:nifR3 family TIM-barrel protein